jgi:hypothetical protein
MGSINYITTIINMRAPGMTWFRMPLTIWSLFIVAVLLLLALPVLTSALAMLLFDRMFGTHFFIPAGGGEPLLWQHLFWFFGHPEVYILVLPAMGITSEILPVFTRKPIFGYRAMVFSMIAIAFLSWVVGTSYVSEWMNPPGHGVHAHHDVIECVTLNLQLARDAMGGQDYLPLADAVCPGFCVPVHHWWPERHFYGFDSGGHFYPRHVLHRGAHSLRRGRDHFWGIRRALLLGP